MGMCSGVCCKKYRDARSRDSVLNAGQYEWFGDHFACFAVAIGLFVRSWVGCALKLCERFGPKCFWSGFKGHAFLFCRVYYGQALCVEGDGAIGKWFARSVFKVAQYGVAYLGELHAYLMMAPGGEIYAD